MNHNSMSSIIRQSIESIPHFYLLAFLLMMIPVTTWATCGPPYYKSMVQLSIGSGLSDTVCQGYYQQYSFPVNSGSQYKVTVSPIWTSDPNLYVSSQSNVSDSSYDKCSSTNSSGNDSCTFISGVSGSYYVAVKGYRGESSETTYYSIIIEDISPSAPVLSAPSLSIRYNKSKLPLCETDL